MAIVSVYLQAAVQAADHVLYGVVNSISGSAVVVTTDGGSGDTTPFEGAVGKTVRRYTSAEWNASPRVEANAANTGVIQTISSSPFRSFTSNQSTAWAAGNIWAIDYQSPKSFHKWAESDKDIVIGTADTDSARLPKFFRTKVPDEFGVPTLRNGDQDTDPLTTKWELRCDTLGRAYTNSAIPLPLPSPGMGDQYYNKMLDIGMRNEQITMSGTLVDRGIPTASNPRLQTLFDLIRTQHSSTLDTNDEAQGGAGATPNNPRAYMRLTIGSGYEPSDYLESTGVSSAGGLTHTPTYAVNTNLIIRDRNYTPGATAVLGSQRTEKAYRGLVTQFSANLQGGRPDIWQWSMTFNVVKNEHDWTATSE